MLIGKLLGLVVFGAILAMPVHVTAGAVLAPFRLRERWILVASMAFAYTVTALLIFGAD